MSSYRVKVQGLKTKFKQKQESNRRAARKQQGRDREQARGGRLKNEVQAKARMQQESKKTTTEEGQGTG